MGSVLHLAGGTTRTLRALGTQARGPAVSHAAGAAHSASGDRPRCGGSSAGPRAAAPPTPRGRPGAARPAAGRTGRGSPRARRTPGPGRGTTRRASAPRSRGAAPAARLGVRRGFVGIGIRALARMIRWRKGGHEAVAPCRGPRRRRARQGTTGPQGHHAPPASGLLWDKQHKACLE